MPTRARTRTRGKISQHAEPKPGDAFESTVFRWIKGEIAAGRLWLRKDCSQVFWKRTYFSRERQAGITFDIAIEVYAPGTTDVAVRILVECKDSGRKVPVDDVEEFHSKLRQVGAHKGILVSTGGFQRGTFTFAKSNGIGLARFFMPGEVKWELRRTLVPGDSGDCLFTTRDEVLSVLEGESVANVCGRLYGCHGARVTNVPAVLLKAICEDVLPDRALSSKMGTDGGQPASVRFISAEEVRDYVRKALELIRYGGGRVDLDALCANHPETKGLKLQTGVRPADGGASGVLGRVRFDPLEIMIFATSDSDAAKQRFTLAHELGHVILGHGRYIEAESCDSSDLETEALGQGDLARLEWQANRFASELLMPAIDYVATFQELLRRLDVRHRGFGALFVDSQPCNVGAFHSIVGHLSSRYGVTVSAAAVRLNAFGLLGIGDTGGMSKGLVALFAKMSPGSRFQSWSHVGAVAETTQKA